MFKSKNTKKQGDIGVGAAIACFSSNEYVVNIPLTDSQEYDLIVDKDNKLYRVQVKTTSYKVASGNYQVSLTVKGGNRSSTGKIKAFDKNKVDLLYVLTDDGSQYIIPVNDLPKSQVTLCDNYISFKME